MVCISAIFARIPDSCKTVDEQIEFYRKWVESLKGHDSKYWNKRLPDIISVLKDPEAKIRKYEKLREEAFQKLYPVQ